MAGFSGLDAAGPAFRIKSASSPMNTCVSSYYKHSDFMRGRCGRTTRRSHQSQALTPFATSSRGSSWPKTDRCRCCEFPAHRRKRCPTGSPMSVWRWPRRLACTMPRSMRLAAWSMDGLPKIELRKHFFSFPSFFFSVFLESWS